MAYCNNNKCWSVWLVFNNLFLFNIDFYFLFFQFIMVLGSALQLWCERLGCEDSQCYHATWYVRELKSSSRQVWKGGKEEIKHGRILYLRHILISFFFFSLLSSLPPPTLSHIIFSPFTPFSSFSFSPSPIIFTPFPLFFLPSSFDLLSFSPTFPFLPFRFSSFFHFSQLFPFFTSVFPLFSTHS